VPSGEGEGGGGWRVELVAAHHRRPNGLAFSPDGRTLYVSLTDSAVRCTAHSLPVQALVLTRARVLVPGPAVTAVHSEKCSQMYGSLTAVRAVQSQYSLRQLTGGGGSLPRGIRLVYKRYTHGMQ
jgi:DNA-binding beta-propeller fold protein YncE